MLLWVVDFQANEVKLKETVKKGKDMFGEFLSLFGRDGRIVSCGMCTIS